MGKKPTLDESTIKGSRQAIRTVNQKEFQSYVDHTVNMPRDGPYSALSIVENGRRQA